MFRDTVQADLGLPTPAAGHGPCLRGHLCCWGQGKGLPLLLSLLRTPWISHQGEPGEKTTQLARPLCAGVAPSACCPNCGRPQLRRDRCARSWMETSYARAFGSCPACVSAHHGRLEPPSSQNEVGWRGRGCGTPGALPPSDGPRRRRVLEEMFCGCALPCSLPHSRRLAQEGLQCLAAPAPRPLSYGVWTCIDFSAFLRLRSSVILYYWRYH